MKADADDQPTVRPPRHQLLAEELLARIADGTYAVGERLPTEGELCTQYDLARGTVRQALDRLLQLGMINRRPGAGTTVISRTPAGPYQPFASSTTDIAAFAATTRLLRPELSLIVVDRALARRLDLREGTSWHVLQGVRVQRSAPDRPLCWSEHYTPGERELDPKAQFTAESLAAYRVEQRVSAGLLDEEMADALRAEPGSASLVVTRRVILDGEVANIGSHTHPADRYEITTLVSPGR